VSSGFALP